MAVTERALSPSPADALGGPRTFHWTREQYLALADLGWFLGRHVERIEGEILEMPPIGRPHRTAIILVSQALQRAFGDGFFIAGQVPLEVGEASEPDVAVFAGNIRDFADSPLTEAALVVEVSASTLPYDRIQKAALYARAGVEDYWIVNLDHAQLEVRRRPGDLPGGLFGYAETTTYHPGQSVAPRGAPNFPAAVADLLP